MEVETIQEGDHIVELVRIGNVVYREIKNPKCVSCKCYWQPDYDDTKSSGSYYKSCRRCRKPKKTAEQIRDKHREYAKQYRARKKAS